MGSNHIEKPGIGRTYYLEDIIKHGGDILSDSDILRGKKAIMEYIQVLSCSTFYKYVKVGLPVWKNLGGLVSSKRLLNEWNIAQRDRPT